jgi:hypothetical protein
MRPEYQMSHAALKQLLHRNGPTLATTAVGHGLTSHQPG